MHVLYVTPYVPSRIRTRPYNLIRALLDAGQQVTLLAAAGAGPEDQERAEALCAWGVRVELFPLPLHRSLANCLRALPTREPLQAVYAYSRPMERRLEQLARGGTCDVVHVEHLRAARLVRAVDGVPAVYDSVDCIALLFEQTVRSGPNLRARLLAALDLARTRRYEAGLLARFDRVVVTSRRDRQALEQLARRYLPPGTPTAPVDVLTNGVDLSYFHPPVPAVPRDGRTVVFTGKMSYHANVAGALYFARQVLPRVWAERPDVRFQIVGRDPPSGVRQLAADGRIEVTGGVPDLRPYLAGAALAVCPVPYAVGVQSKVLEAMAMETPVVCTAAAFAGLDARPGEDLRVAGDPEAFAAHVLRILSDPSLAARLAASGRHYVEVQHNWQAGAQRLIAIYGQAQRVSRTAAVQSPVSRGRGQARADVEGTGAELPEPG